VLQNVSVTFFSECDHCDQLLADYLSAGNRIVDVKLAQTRNGFSGLTITSVEIQNARKQQKDVLEKFLTHKKREHGLEYTTVKTRPRA
jgi:hypothetical protein